MKYQLVFIGFGEASYNIALGLKSEGFESMAAYDVFAEDPKRGELIQSRAQEAGIPLIGLDEACNEGACIASMNSAKVALSVAKDIIPRLKAGQIFVDLNSAAPTVEEEIDKIPRAHGVLFCDAGVMGTVPGNRHKVPMFLSGGGAQSFYDAFAPCNMKLTVLDAPAGGASAIKMLKSVVMKGLPQLMFESFEAAEKYGVLSTLAESLGESINGKTVEKLANTFIARTMIHAERRSAEMRDVVSTLESLKVDASMSKATVAKLDALAAQQWADKIDPSGDLDYREAIKLLVKQNEEDGLK